MVKKLIFFLMSLMGCEEIQTTDPAKTYRHWAGSSPPAEVEVLQGQYWESAHWTKEYVMYLKLRPSDIWWNAFVEQNELIPDPDEWTMPTDAPDWFEPSEDAIRYLREASFDEGSRYFIEGAGVAYIYEKQL